MLRAVSGAALANVFRETNMETNDYTWPVVTVLICTYNRPFELGATFGALSKNLHYPRLHWHLADDGSPEETLQVAVTHIKPFVEARGETFTHSVTNRKGWGANVNYATRVLGAHSGRLNEFIYFTEDDYVLKRPLDLRPYVAAMQAYEQVGMVRFGIAGHDGVRACLRELDVSSILPDYTEQDGYGSVPSGRMNVWELDLGHQEEWGPFGFFRYSNRPHLKHRRFHAAYGSYQEGKTLAETEQAMNHVITDRWENTPVVGTNPPSIVVPANWTFWHFDHIGKSRQGTEEDVHA